jgi:radical SAM protein with 4Fe4S-binding SPASM domain
MKINALISQLKEQYNIVGHLDLDQWFQLPMYQREIWLRTQLETLHQPVYADNDRIIVSITNVNKQTALDNLMYYLERVDITNFFVILLTNEAVDLNSDQETSVTVLTVDNELIDNQKKHSYDYNDTALVKDIALTDRQSFLLNKSQTFCIYPWIHLHAYPTGEAHPCCHSEMRYSIGNTHKNTLKEIWNSPEQRQLRVNMLNEMENPACQRCYEQEQAGFLSGRRSANKHHGHHIGRVEMTKSDGTLDHFGMTYWDIRFSNLCNLSCRSCGHIFSSSWYQDQIELAGPTWALNNSALNIAGRDKNDMWNQLMPHLDYVEQIYFAGGEPLMMEEHYNILDELERRGRFDVRLVYNTNFTQTKLKDREVFDYWRRFKSVAVGASLDGAGPYAEYIRRGTRWAQVERNREEMLRVCPEVDFYISPTLSILNAWHLPDFHRDWVEKGFIKPQDLNVNVLQDPAYLRIDIATAEYKQKLNDKYQEHIKWLKPQDQLKRATVGFESAVNFLMATDNTALISKFWEKTNQLDQIRKENLLDVVPELSILK